MRYGNSLENCKVYLHKDEEDAWVARMPLIMCKRHAHGNIHFHEKVDIHRASIHQFQVNGKMFASHFGLSLNTTKKGVSSVLAPIECKDNYILRCEGSNPTVTCIFFLFTFLAFFVFQIWTSHMESSMTLQFREFMINDAMPKYLHGSFLKEDEKKEWEFDETPGGMKFGTKTPDWVFLWRTFFNAPHAMSVNSYF